MKMNYDFVVNAIKAREYTKAAIESILPKQAKQTKEHMSVIKREFKAMIIDCLNDDDEKKYYDGENESVSNADTSTKTECGQNEKNDTVKKETKVHSVTID